MNYLTVKDLKQTRKIWEQLKDDRELVITREGKPCAVLIGVNPENCEESVKEIRRSLFSAAISRIRAKSANRQIQLDEINDIINETRKANGIGDEGCA